MQRKANIAIQERIENAQRVAYARNWAAQEDKRIE